MSSLNKIPALLIGCLSLLGFFIPLYPLLLVPFVLLSTLFPFFPKRGKIAYLIGFPLSMITLVLSSSMLPELPSLLKGHFYFAIDEIKESKRAFGEGVVYRGHVICFEAPEKKVTFCKIPSILYLNQKKPFTNDLVLIEGSLNMKTPYLGSLKPALKTEWTPKSFTSFAEKRFKLKKKLDDFIKKKYSYSDTKTLISGLVTGNFDDFLVSQEFSRVGLSHLMAISGFHFSVMANVLGFFCINSFKRKTATLLLMFFLSSYFLFLGTSASVLRAWIMILIGLGEHFVEKKSEPLNSLGIAIIFLLFIHPTEVLKPAFWLSYGITASILLFSVPFETLLDKVFKKRAKEEVRRLTPLNQWGYFGLNLLKKALALNLAVTVFALPLTLFFFHKFPLISLLVNLLFPPLVGLSLLFFLLSLIFFPLGKTIDLITDYYTHSLIELITNLPLKVDFVLRVTSFTPLSLGMILLSLFLFGLHLKTKKTDFS